MRGYAIAVLAALLLGCGGGDDEAQPFGCAYEKRTTSCNSSAFGEWQSGCSNGPQFGLREGLTPATFCQQTYPASDSECAGGCCVQFQYRNVAVRSGGCS